MTTDGLDIIAVDMKLDMASSHVVQDIASAMGMLFRTAREKWGDAPFLGPQVRTAGDITAIELTRING